MIVSLSMGVRARRVRPGPQPRDERVGLAGRHPGERIGQQVQAEDRSRSSLTRPGLRLRFPSSIPIDWVMALAGWPSIVYRRLTMDIQQDRPLDRATAEQYASWFKALADPTRVQIVSLLARRAGPMTVGEITAAVAVGQSTVSAHLKILADVRFVLAERRGTASWYRVNDRCVACFPTAADIVMGRPVPAAPAC
jgi:DNA-binding transcriptional ArsR family regulator